MTERDDELFRRLNALEVAHGKTTVKVAAVEKAVGAMDGKLDTLVIRLSRFGGIGMGIGMSVSAIWVVLIAAWKFLFDGSAPTH